MRKTLKQFIKFGIVGTSGLAIGLGIINITMILGTSFIFANTIAFFIAATWNFLLNRRFTFEKNSINSFSRQWIQFIASSSFGVVCNWIVSFSLYYNVPLFKKHYNLPALIGVLVGCMVNFICSKFFIFTSSSSLKQQEANNLV